MCHLELAVPIAYIFLAQQTIGLYVWASIGKNADDKPSSSPQFDPTSSELFTTQNTQCYQCLTPYYSSLIILCRGGQFQSDEEGLVCPVIPAKRVKWNLQRQSIQRAILVPRIDFLGIPNQADWEIIRKYITTWNDLIHYYWSTNFCVSNLKPPKEKWKD